MKVDEDGIHLCVRHPFQAAQHVDYLKESIDFSMVWKASYYTLKSTSQVLPRADMVPGMVIVQPYAGIPTLKVWFGAEAEAQRRLQQRQRQRSNPSGARASAARGRGRGRGRGRLLPALPDQDQDDQMVDAVVMPAPEIPSGSDEAPSEHTDADVSSQDVPNLEQSAGAPELGSQPEAARRLADRVPAPPVDAGQSDAGASSSAARAPAPRPAAPDGEAPFHARLRRAQEQRLSSKWAMAPFITTQRRRRFKHFAGTLAMKTAGKAGLQLQVHQQSVAFKDGPWASCCAGWKMHINMWTRTATVICTHAHPMPEDRRPDELSCNCLAVQLLLNMSGICDLAKEWSPQLTIERLTQSAVCSWLQPTPDP